jgi:hypothetical protein
MFVVSEGNFLGNIVSKEGIYTNPERINGINELNPPTYEKGVQSFFGKINFVRIFVLDYENIVNPINLFLKKYEKFEWTHDIQTTFTKVKHAITTSPMLFNPNFDHDFIICSFSSGKTIASILT